MNSCVPVCTRMFAICYSYASVCSRIFRVSLVCYRVLLVVLVWCFRHDSLSVIFTMFCPVDKSLSYRSTLLLDSRGRRIKAHLIFYFTFSRNSAVLYWKSAILIGSPTVDYSPIEHNRALGSR